MSRDIQLTRDELRHFAEVFPMLLTFCAAYICWEQPMARISTRMF